MVTLETLNSKVEKLQGNVDKILEILEEHTLTDEAKDELKKARATPKSEYTPHETVKKLLK